MSPATTMDTTLPSSSSLYHIPQLSDDGTNWITYKERAQTVIRARGLMRYLDGRTKEPVPFEIDSQGQALKPNKSVATQTEIEEQEKKEDEFQQKDSLVKQHIFSTVSDQLLLHIQNLGQASNIWAEVCRIHEGKTEMVQIDLRRKLQDTRCEEGRDVTAHFGDLLRIRE
jgi:gag-polypeptide of LTR copia-type